MMQFKAAEAGTCPTSGVNEAFDCALRRRSARLDARPERPDDIEFVLELSTRCSPLARILPPAMLAQQAAAQDKSHRAQHPAAMRRIVGIGAIPAARIVVDWGADRISHGVDIAVLPEFRSTGAGLHMLRAWLEVADCGGWRCTLDVSRENPAMAIYSRLGFAAAVGAEVDSPFVRMARLPRVSA